MTRSSILTLISATVICIIAASSCTSKGSGRQLTDIQQELIQVTADSTATSEAACKLFKEYADSLYLRASTYGENLGIRVDAQKRAGIAMTLAAMKLDNPEDLERVTEDFNRVISTWIINPDPEAPELYKEIYCVTDDQMDDCVMVDVAFDYEDHGKIDGGVVWLPHNADNDIEVVFANMKEDGSEPDFDNAIFADIVGFAPAGSMAPGSPLAAKIGNTFYQNLMDYELLFVGYTSANGNPESFVLRLETLHEQVSKAGGVFANL